MKNKISIIALAALGIALLLTPGLVLADSINPTSVTATIGVGGSVTVHKTVTISSGSPTTAQGDVYFLSDTTGSMGGTIGNVKANATAILAGLAGFGNIETAAGYYRDFYTGYESRGWGSPGDLPYHLNAAMDGSATTQAGINAWSAGGGNDGLESEIYALDQMALQDATGWRDGSAKFALWFGDIGGHEPSNTSGYPGPSTAQTISDLQAEGIKVYAFNVGNLDSLGQATAITTATGGHYYSTTPSGSAIVDAIVGAIGSGFENYSTVGIESPSLTGLGIDIVPTSYSGTFDRSIERTFGFDVTFTGIAPGTYTFDLFGTVDGGRVATESDVITVGGGPAIPEPSTLLLLGAGLAGLAAFRKRISK